MHVSIRNLGPLREADLDLSKRLIVLTGPNNSGKTYLTWTLYGLLGTQQGLESEPPEAARELARMLLDSPEVEVSPHDNARYRARILAETADAFALRLGQFFAVSPDSFSTTTIKTELDGSDQVLGGTLRLNLRPTPQGTVSTSLSFAPLPGAPLRLVRSPMPPGAVLSGGFQDGEPPTPLLNPEQRFRVLESLAGLLRFASLPPWGLVLFPAERIAINVFARELSLKRTELVDEVLDGAPPGLIQREAGRYPVPIRDGIRLANDLPNAQRHLSGMQDLATELEQILGGSIDLSEGGEIVFTPEHSPERRLAFHVTSSLVKSLASLAFFFRHQATQDAWVLIDEPELNLHPDLQRKVARFLAKAVMRGVRIIMSTHSDYVVRELSNLVRLGERGAKGRELAGSLGYDPEALLPADYVGAWLLRDGKAEALPVSADGFTVPTIDDAIEAQNGDTQAISFGLPE